MKTIEIPNALYSHFIRLVELAFTYVEASRTHLTPMELRTMRFAKRLIDKFDKKGL
jgi:hypothetical protein